MSDVSREVFTGVAAVSGIPLERVLKMGSCGGQSLKHKTDHADPDHRLTVIQSHFIISAKPSRLVKPSEGALDDPSFRQNLEAFGSAVSTHDLQPQLTEGAQLLDPLHQSSQVAAVGPDDLQSPIHGYQEVDEALGGVAVLHGGGSDHNPQNQSQAVDGHVALAPRHLLARVVAAFSCLFGDLDRLAVNDRCGGRNLSLLGFAQTVPQRVVNECPGPILAPLPVVAIDGLPRTKIFGQQPPGATRTHFVKDRVDQIAAIQLDWSAAFSFSRFGSRNQSLDVFPFFIAQVCRVTSRMRLHPSHLY